MTRCVLGEALGRRRFSIKCARSRRLLRSLAMTAVAVARRANCFAAGRPCDTVLQTCQAMERNDVI